MKFFAAVAAALLGAEAVMASPVTLTPRTPRASKRSELRRTRPRVSISSGSSATTAGAESKSSINTVVTTNETTNGNNTRETSYSSNWAGAVLIGTGYKSVTGTFTVPTPEIPSGGSSTTEYAASAWVGIDGDTCSTAILQTGIDFNVQGTSVTFDAWYEWYPDYAYTFTNFGISAGDVITLTASATSTTAGSVLIENQTTGKSVTHSFTGESNALCETNAEWIVEDFEEGSSLVPFANFGTVTFSDCSVTETSGTKIGVSGATIIDLRQNSQVLTSCSTTGSSTVSCEYV